MVSQRLNELIAEANRFRTKACGMNSMIERAVRERQSGDIKIAGKTIVT